MTSGPPWQRLSTRHCSAVLARRFARDHGAVLDGRPGHDAVILRGRIAVRTTSAALTLEFLRDGLTNDYRYCGDVGQALRIPNRRRHLAMLCPGSRHRALDKCAGIAGDHEFSHVGRHQLVFDLLNTNVASSHVPDE
jgi:hypothetical protein